MTKRFLQTGFLSGLVIGIVVTSLAYGVATMGAQAPQGGPAPARG